jgi:hypothetical protein
MNVVPDVIHLWAPEISTRLPAAAEFGIPTRLVQLVSIEVQIIGRGFHVTGGNRPRAVEHSLFWGFQGVIARKSLDVSGYLTDAFLVDIRVSCVKTLDRTTGNRGIEVTARRQSSRARYPCVFCGKDDQALASLSPGNNRWTFETLHGSRALSVTY